MEFAYVEPVAEGGFGLGAQGADLELTDLVGRRLARPADISGHFGLDVQRRQRGIFYEAGFGLFAGPAIPVQAGIGDEAAGPPHLIGQRAEALVGRLVDAGLARDTFGIQAPALAEGGSVILLPEAGLIRHFLRQRDLQVVAGDRFMGGEGWEFVKWTLLKRVGVYKVTAQSAFGRIALRIPASGVAGRN